MLRVAGPGAQLSLRAFAKYVMRTRNVGTRMSVHRYADAMDLLGLVRYDRREGVTILPPPSIPLQEEPVPVAVHTG